MNTFYGRWCYIFMMICIIEFLLLIIAATTPAKPPRLCSVREMQMFLNMLEPNNQIDEDGVCGKATVEKWDRLYNQQCAIESILRAKK